MPAPTNTDFSTATDLGLVFPVTISQRVDDAGTTYAVFFKFTAPFAAVVMGAFGFGDLVTYTPVIRPFDASFNQLLPGSSLIGAVNRPIQFPVTVGQVYYLEVTPPPGNPSPANLTLTVQVAPNLSVPRGSIVVPDDTFGFPLAVISGTDDFLVRRFIPNMPAGEAGDTLQSGVVLIENGDNRSADLYSSVTGALIQQTVLNHTIRIRTCQTPQRFYVGTDANPSTVRTIDADGTVGAPITLSGVTSLFALAVKNDETVIYYAETGVNKAIRKADSTGAFIGNLASGIANYAALDALYLANDRIVVGYAKTPIGAGSDYKTVIYDTAGSTLLTTTFGAFTNTQPRLAYALDDPNSFWVLFHPFATPGLSQFLNVSTSDGSILITRQAAEFEVGDYRGAMSATPLASFGVSFSCPFWIVPKGPIIPPITTPIPTLIDSSSCCASPVEDLPQPQDLTTPGFNVSCIGGGTVPTHGDVSPVELWDY